MCITAPHWRTLYLYCSAIGTNITYEYNIKNHISMKYYQLNHSAHDPTKCFNTHEQVKVTKCKTTSGASKFNFKMS